MAEIEAVQQAGEERAVLCALLDIGRAEGNDSCRRCPEDKTTLREGTGSFFQCVCKPQVIQRGGRTEKRHMPEVCLR